MAVATGKPPADALALDQLSIEMEGRRIIRDISIGLQEGEIGCLLGPSGCGKTTLLRVIAGFEPPVAGQVYIGGVLASSPTHLVPVDVRRTGMVFQDLALFPHFSVADNILFGLHKQPGRRQRLRELLALLDLEALRDKYPHRLSGGEQQRVALARAMAPRPQMLLLDEPFSNLDAELREQFAWQLRQVLRQEGITTLMVSHNQLEAFAMADRVGVIQRRRLLQWDTPFQLYHEPSCVEVANFIGEGTFIRGRVVAPYTVATALGDIRGKTALAQSLGSAVSVLIRPDDVLHDDDSPMQAKVLNKAFRGASFLYTLELAHGGKVLSLVPSHHDHPLGEPIGIRLEIDHLVVFSPADTEKLRHARGA